MDYYIWVGVMMASFMGIFLQVIFGFCKIGRGLDNNDRKDMCIGIIVLFTLSITIPVVIWLSNLGGGI